GPGPIITRPTPAVTAPPPGGITTVPPVAPVPPYTAPPYCPTPPPPGPVPHVYGTPACEPPFFSNWELQFLVPAVSNHLHNTVVLPDGTTKTIAIPGAGLDWSVAPVFELGFRLPDHLGQFSAAYRFFNTSGTQSQTIDGVPMTVHSLLDLN